MRESMNQIKIIISGHSTSVACWRRRQPHGGSNLAPPGLGHSSAASSSYCLE